MNYCFWFNNKCKARHTAVVLKSRKKVQIWEAALFLPQSGKLFSLWGNRATTLTQMIYCTIFAFLTPYAARLNKIFHFASKYVPVYKYNIHWSTRQAAGGVVDIWFSRRLIMGVVDCFKNRLAEHGLARFEGCLNTYLYFSMYRHCVLYALFSILKSTITYFTR